MRRAKDKMKRLPALIYYFLALPVLFGHQENDHIFVLSGAWGLLGYSFYSTSSRGRCLQHQHFEFKISSPLPESESYSLEVQNINQNDSNDTQMTIRLNKVFRATHSRRQADELIAQGRVSINATSAIVQDMGRRVQPFCDRVYLDGKLYSGWEQRHGFVPSAKTPSGNSGTSRKRTTSRQSPETMENDTRRGHHVISSDVKEDYIKFWKPVGVVSTTDRGVRNNLLDALEKEYQRRQRGQKQGQKPRTTLQSSQHLQIESPSAISKISRHRIFSVGRLDKDSSGLLLLTSDGRIPNAVLRKEFKQPKTYHVSLDKPITDHDLDRLRHGIVITTDTVRNGKHIPITARTLPCQVQRLQAATTAKTKFPSTICSNAAATSVVVNDRISSGEMKDDRTIQITLLEGRNRQIRVMLQSLGYRVIRLHRTTFMGIDLNGLHRAGDYAVLTKSEVALLEAAVQKMSTTANQGA